MKTQELQDGWIRDAEEYITDEAITASAATVLPVATVMVAMYGATAGMLGMLGRPMTCNQACCALIVEPSECDPRFLFYSLLNSRPEIVSLAVGAASRT